MLVSGGGTNLQSLIDKIECGYIDGRISIVISDRPDVYALERARKHGIPAVVLDKSLLGSSGLDDSILQELSKYNIDLVVLAGYLSILSEKLIKKYKNAIVNIHPSLIPSFCGPGCYGLIVHKKAIEYGVKISGCTVHFVDEGTDTGPIILQKAVDVDSSDTPETLQKKILKYEHEILPEAVRLICNGDIEVAGRKVIIREGKK